MRRKSTTEAAGFFAVVLDLNGEGLAVGLERQQREAFVHFHGA